MKTSTVLLFLCLAFIANASVLDVVSYIQNHTELKGKVAFNTANGISLNYNGTVNFESGKTSIKIADLAANFNAVPDKSVKNEQVYNYTAGVVVANGAPIASANLDGGVEFGVTNGINNQTGVTKVTYTVKGKNFYNLRGAYGPYSANATGSAALNLEGDDTINGGQVGSFLNISGNGQIAGDLAYNNQKVAFGSLTKNANAVVNNNVQTPGSSSSKIVHVSFRGEKIDPAVVSLGNIKYNEDTTINWNGSSQYVVRGGNADLQNVAWNKKTQDSNGNSSTFGISEDINFTITENAFVNGTEVDSVTVGNIAVVRQGGSRTNLDGTWSKSLGSNGTVKGQSAIANKTTSESASHLKEFKVNCLLSKFYSSKALQEKCAKLRELFFSKNSDGATLANFGGAWRQTANANGSFANDGSANVNFGVGTDYQLNSINNATNKLWNYQGNKSVTGTISAPPGQAVDVNIDY